MLDLILLNFGFWKESPSLDIDQEHQITAFEHRKKEMNGAPNIGGSNKNTEYQILN